jgi:peptidoglycan/LPS O-acetylase OafA/YrhL
MLTAGVGQASGHAPDTHSDADRGAAVWRRRLDIQGLRGIAVLLVVLFHAGLNLPGGFTGVDVFFVISGFVIGGVLLAELERTDGIDLLRFYGRRIRRLLPALALMVTVVALAGVLLAPVAADHIGGITGIFASLFSANVYLIRSSAGYFAADEALNPFLHTWTLAVEEQFYLVFPALLLLFWVVGRRRRRGSPRLAAAVVISCVSLMSFALALGLSAAHESFAFYSSPTRAWEFGLGALVVLATPLLGRLSVSIGTLAGIGGLGAIAVGALAIHNTANYPNASALLPTIGAGAVIAAGTIDREGVARLVGARPLVWLGDLSYSWYLWHWPFIVFAVALWPTHRVPVSIAAAALSLLPAWASFRYVENPIRTNPQITGRRILALAAVCVSVPILACLGFLGFSDALRTRPALAAWQLSQEAHLDHVRGCDSGKPFGSEPAECTWVVPHARGKLVLVGDSYAGQVSEAVVSAGNSEGLDVSVATFPACPFINVRVYGSNPTEAECRRYYTRGLRALLRAHPSLVVTSFRADHYTEDHQIRLAVGRHGRATTSTAAKDPVIQRALASTLRSLNAQGIPVLVVDPVPWYPAPIGACAALRILTRSCPTTVVRSVEDRALAGPIRIDTLAVRDAPRSFRLNLEDELCSRARCSDVKHQVDMYRDFDHLSVLGTQGITSVFARAIRRSVGHQ